MDELKLSDESIGHIAKILQVALLTGTDVVDNLRLIGFQNSDGSLIPHPSHATSFEKSLNTMVEEANQKMLQAMIESGTLPEGMTEEEAKEMQANFNKLASEAMDTISLSTGESGDVKEW